MRGRTVKDILGTLVIVLLTLAPLSLHAAPEPDPTQAAQEALRASIRSLGLQTKIPTDAAPIKEENKYVPDRPPIIPADIAQIVLLVAVAAIVIVIILTLRDNLWSSSRARKLRHTDEEETAPIATAARMEKAQSEADELARQGSFAEAMHVLLLQSVSELRRRLDVSIAASLTSREILHRIGLPPSERAIFADIIGRVEISYFGSHQPGEEEYLACRRSFEALREALRRGGSS